MFLMVIVINHAIFIDWLIKKILIIIIPPGTGLTGTVISVIDLEKHHVKSPVWN